MSEKVDQKVGKMEDDRKEEKKPETPAAPPSGPKPPVWPKVMLLWMALQGLCWGATIAQALSNGALVGQATVRLGRDVLSQGGLAVGAAVAVAFLFFLRKKLGARIAWTKPGQGKWTRPAALIALAALASFGVTAFYRLPPSTSIWWSGVLAEWDLAGKPLTIRPILFPAAGIFLTVMFVLHLLLNQEKWAEFLIETEGELKKVSWPARKEYLGSATVVVLVVAIISVFLYLVDHGMSRLFSALRIGF